MCSLSKPVGPILVLLALCLSGQPAYAKYSGGTGEPNDPYQIATAADLITLGETPADYDKHFILTADIDLDPNLPGRKVFDKAVIAPDTNDADSGFQGTPFTGVFSGNGHTISHLTIRGNGYLGLFGQLKSAGQIKNVGVVETTIAGSDYVGGLAGYNEGSVMECYSTSIVSGASAVGVLIGANSASLGGNMSYYGTVADCYATGSVRGTECVGGLTGTNAGYVTRCYSMARVGGTGKNIGGMIGCGSAWVLKGPKSIGRPQPVLQSGSTTDCFWDMQTSGQTTSDGGAGKTTSQMQDPNTFVAAGWEFVPHDIWVEPEGGGYPILWWQLPPGLGLPGFSGGTGEPTNPYRISQARELNSIGHNPRLMGCHFKLVSDLDLAELNFYPIGDYDRPYSGVFDGNGRTISHLTIRGGGHLGLFARLANKAEVKNLGVVDVNVVSSDACVGALVGYSSGAVTNCYSTGAVSGTRFSVGGLVGQSSGNVANSYSTAAVSGRECSVGGLVGQNWRGHVTECRSSGPVNGTGRWAGGLVGDNDGTVIYCYTTGSVVGEGYVGGLVGFNCGVVTDCYSTRMVRGRYGVGALVGVNGFWVPGWLSASDPGLISRCYASSVVSGDLDVGGLLGRNDYGDVTGCFWDTQTSGQTTSVAGTGKTTPEMQMASTFFEAGWDFVGETANGTEDIWWIDEGKDYPRLWWENAPQ